MFSEKTGVAIIAMLLGAAVFAGCGGGGSESESGITLPSKFLSWVPPTSFTNNESLNPLTDLEGFEIYVKGSGSFSESDMPVALVGAVNRSTGQAVTSFNLANLSPIITPGIQYHVAVRAVGISGVKSSFSGASTFSF